MSDSGHPTRRDVVLRAGLDLGIAEYGARPGQSGDVRTSFLAVPEEQASRQCQQDSSRLAKGVRKTTKGLRRQCAAGELTTPQCPVLMHLVRVAPTTTRLRQKIIRDGDGDAVKASAKTSREKASGLSIRLQPGLSAGGSCWIPGKFDHAHPRPGT